jgi:DME family drug/metabolite transporter
MVSPFSAAVLAVAAAALLWSTGGLFIKLAPMPAMAVACGRSLIAGVFYLVLLRPNLRAARWTTAAAYAGCIISFVTATRLTTAANAIFLQYTAPAYVLLLSPWLLREKLRPIDLWCVLLSLFGMSLFFVDKVQAGQTLGNVLGIVSGVFFAFNIVLLRRDGGDALASMTLGNLVAAAVTLPFALPQLSLTPMGVGVLLYLGIVQLGLAYWLFARGVRQVPAAEASVICMLEPIFNPVWVLIGTGERPGPWAIAGGVVVIAAVALRTQRASTASV